MPALIRFFVVIVLLPVALASCAPDESPAPADVATETAMSSPPPAAPTSTEAPTGIAASPPPPAASAAGIATADGERPGVTATITELKRSSGGTLSLRMTITNGSQEQLNTSYEFADPDHSIVDFNSFGGVHLIDPVGKKKYFVARDSESKCVCSQGVKSIEPGTSANVWAKFPAPPADVQMVSVIVPHFSPMDDVPISGN